MENRFIYISIALIGLSILLFACNQSTQEAAPPTVIPTTTLLPIFITETPRVTATLTPSDTPTASDTPPPSETPTPVTPTATVTLTPTPPIVCIVVSTQDNVNVRAEATFSSDVASSVEPGTQVEVHGASEDEQWIRVRFIAVEGALVEGWINEPLIDCGDFVVPTIGPTLTPTIDPDITLAAFVTATPDGSVTPGTPAAEVEVGEDLSDVNVLAYCRSVDSPAPGVRADQTVSIEWSWFVARPELMADHLEHATYEILLDGRLLTNYEDFQTEMRREAGDWYVYWFVPVGTLTPGRHEVTYLLTWDEPVSDGYDEFGPGTENETNEGNCVFTVN